MLTKVNKEPNRDVTPQTDRVLTAPQPWVNSKLIEIDEEVGSGRVVHRKSPGKLTVDGTGGLLAPKQVRVCECVQKLTLKSSGVVVGWCGELKTPRRVNGNEE